MRSTSGFRSLPSACHCSGGSSQIRRTIDSGNPDAVKQLLRELIDRVEITPDRHAYPYFWVPAGLRDPPSERQPRPGRATGARPSGGHRLAFRYIRWPCVVAIRTRGNCWTGCERSR